MASLWQDGLCSEWIYGHQIRICTPASLFLTKTAVPQEGLCLFACPALWRGPQALPAQAGGCGWLLPLPRSSPPAFLPGNGLWRSRRSEVTHQRVFPRSPGDATAPGSACPVVGGFLLRLHPNCSFCWHCAGTGGAGHQGRQLFWYLVHLHYNGCINIAAHLSSPSRCCGCHALKRARSVAWIRAWIALEGF